MTYYIALPYVILVSLCSGVLGFMVCAVLAMGKRTDLEMENEVLRAKFERVA